MNRAAYMTGLNKLEFCDLPMPSIGNEDVLVKLEYVGICGSDTHYLRNGRIGNFIVKDKMILGHECAGVVMEVGSQVRHLQVGDKVALEPGVPCGTCAECRSGKYNLCKDVKFLATPPYDGAFVRYISYPANMAFKLPENMDTKQGALLEPLAVGLHAAKQGEVGLGNRVAILGSGCIGLVTLLACKAMGAADITVADLSDDRLAVARRLGATRTVNTAQADLRSVIYEATQGEGCDKVFETAGAAATTKMTVEIVRRGGRIVLVGMAPDDEIGFNFVELISKEAEIKTVFRYRNLYPVAIDAVSSGRIDINGIVSHEFPFEQLPQAFDKSGPDVIKTIIRMT